MLLTTCFDEPFRGTRDLDLLGYSDPALVPETLVGDKVAETTSPGFTNDMQKGDVDGAFGCVVHALDNRGVFPACVTENVRLQLR